MTKKFIAAFLFAIITGLISAWIYDRYAVQIRQKFIPRAQ